MLACTVQDRLSTAATDAVNDLLPSYASNNLSSLCSWADRVKFRYRWSSALHYIDTPDNLCNYNYGSGNCTQSMSFTSCYVSFVLTYMLHMQETARMTMESLAAVSQEQLPTTPTSFLPTGTLLMEANVNTAYTNFFLNQLADNLLFIQLNAIFQIISLKRFSFSLISLVIFTRYMIDARILSIKPSIVL